MSNLLRDLYQQVIIDHSKNPHNFCECVHANHVQEGHNPLCGDQVKLYINVENDKIVDISFQGHGCAISMASTSLMTEAVKGKTVEEFLQLFADFQNLVTRTAEQAQETSDETMQHLGKLAVLAGVREFPIRVKCATLPWHTLKTALTEKKDIVTTEENVSC